MHSGRKNEALETPIECNGGDGRIGVAIWEKGQVFSVVLIIISDHKEKYSNEFHFEETNHALQLYTLLALGEHEFVREWPLHS
jgi:hypothetical protein